MSATIALTRIGRTGLTSRPSSSARADQACERCLLRLDVSDRGADRRQAELGHERRARRGADRPVERHPLAARPGPDLDLLLHLEEAAGVRERLAVERAVEDLPALAEPLARLLHLDPERVVLVLGRASPDPEVEVLLVRCVSAAISPASRSGSYQGVTRTQVPSERSGKRPAMWASTSNGPGIGK